jgi:hypothetical protein
MCSRWARYAVLPETVQPTAERDRVQALGRPTNAVFEGSETVPAVGVLRCNSLGAGARDVVHCEGRSIAGAAPVHDGERVAAGVEWAAACPTSCDGAGPGRSHRVLQGWLRGAGRCDWCRRWGSDPHGPRGVTSFLAAPPLTAIPAPQRRAAIVEYSDAG